MSKHCRMNLVVNNLAAPGLQEEHGFALHLRLAGRSMLFDTGQGGALAGNAARLGIHLDSLDDLIISHGHYDHTGGLPALLHVNHQVHVHAHPGILQSRYHLAEGKARSIAIPTSAAQALAALPPARLHWSDRPTSLHGELGLTGQIPRESPFEDTGGAFFLDSQGNVPDHLPDDQAAWFATPTGTVVCVGCCHSGLINTVRAVQRLTREPRIRAIVGGFHLLQASAQRLDATIAFLQQLSPQLIILCHCSGEAATARLQTCLGPMAQPGRAGDVYEF